MTIETETVKAPDRCPICGAPVHVYDRRVDAEHARDGNWVQVVSELWRCDNGHEGPVLYAGGETCA